MTRALLLACSSILAGVSGCSVPQPLERTPVQLEEFRRTTKRVGVVFNYYPVEVDFVFPARGAAGGAIRGFVVGAGLPLAIGAVLPIPGTTYVGLVVAPFTGLGGLIYGIVVAVPAERIEDAHGALNFALERLYAEESGDLTANGKVVCARLEALTGLEAVPLPAELGPRRPNHLPDYHGQAVDAVLEIRTERVGLSGGRAINPDLSAYFEFRVRLVRVRDGVVLFDHPVVFRGEEREFAAWGAGDGEPFYREIKLCYDRVGEKVLEDLFLSYPLPEGER